MQSRTSGKGKNRELPIEAQAVMPLGKQLAHTDKRVRDQAVHDLAAFLSLGGGDVEASGNDITLRSESGPSTGGHSLSELEMRKLWKGLFYCFWMSDKPLVQQRLASDLSSLILAIQPEQPQSESDFAMDFIAGFWEAMIREWGGIDRLRMDKFYLLIRRFVAATFMLLLRSNWDEKRMERLESILSAPSGPMSWQDAKVPASLAYHLSDIWLEELDKVLGLPENDALPAPVAILLRPFISLLSCTPSTITYNRVTLAVFTPLLTALTPPEAGERPPKRAKREPSADIDLFGNIKSNSRASTVAEAATPQQVAQSVLKEMMNRASLGVEQGVREANRRKVYGFVREWGGVDDEE